jgi:hypothetical protein
MPTAKEYRAEAKACRELVDQATEVYVKSALIELARDYEQAARQAEHRERDRAAFASSVFKHTRLTAVDERHFEVPSE